MRWLDAARTRLGLLFGRDEIESRSDEEFRFHLDMETERLVREMGLDPAEARRRALVTFGGVDQHREALRDGRGLAWLDGFALDFRLGMRMLRKHLALTVIGGLGMAVAVAIGAGFFIFLTFYYSNPPVADGHRVVTVDYIDGDDSRSTLFDYQAWKNELTSVEDLAAYRTVNRHLERPTFGSGPARVAEVTASAFRVARIPPLLGRPLLDSDEVEGAQPVIVIGYREWQQRFAADPAVIGSELRLDGIAYTVVGVMPETFRLPVNHGFWTALVTGTPLGPADGPRIHVFGRLAPGVEAAAAEAEAAVIGQRMTAEHPGVYERFDPVVRPYVRHILDLQQYPAWVIWLSQLFGCLVLVVVAVNVAVLFYARAAQRRTEFTVRSALGAARSRIVTQLFLEAFALSAVAAVAGLLIARLGLELLFLVEEGLRDDLPYWLDGGLPIATILYAVGLAALAAFVIGVGPALQVTGRQLQTTLREIGAGAGPRIGTTWTVLICVQVGLAVTVLPAVVGIAWNYTPSPKPAFPATEILSFSLPQAPWPGAVAAGQTGPYADNAALQAELLRRVEAVPEVSTVTFTAGSSPVRIELDDRDAATEPNPSVIRSNRIDIGYFGAFGVQLLAGRTFGRVDTVEGATAVIVNRAFVDRYFAGGEALGRRFREVPVAESEVSASAPWFEVVGVVEDMLRPYRGSASPQTYHATALSAAPLTLAARTRGMGAAAIAPRVRDIAAEVAPGLYLSATPMDEGNDDLAEMGVLLLLMGLVTLSVLLLSAGGIAAMMSFAVTQRRREIGIRAALGASRREIVTSIFSRSTRQLGIGLLAGTAGAAFLDRLAGGELLGGAVVPLLAVVSTIMVLSGLIATVGPTRRALRVEAMEALRGD